MELIKSRLNFAITLEELKVLVKLLGSMSRSDATKLGLTHEEDDLILNIFRKIDEILIKTR